VKECADVRNQPEARQVYDAKGKLVTPGLIDMHTHVYNAGIPLSVDSDIVGWQNGVTTVLDCGSTGASTFPGFRRFLHLGMPLEQVIAGAASTPARIMNFPEKVGTLEPGVTADVAVLELERGSFEYNDGARQLRTLKQRFVAAATIKGGYFLKGAPPAAGRGGAGGPGRGAVPGTAPGRG
jgi:predicted amidohydrolase